MPSFATLPLELKALIVTHYIDDMITTTIYDYWVNRVSATFHNTARYHAAARRSTLALVLLEPAILPLVRCDLERRAATARLESLAVYEEIRQIRHFSDPRQLVWTPLTDADWAICERLRNARCLEWLLVHLLESF